MQVTQLSGRREAILSIPPDESEGGGSKFGSLPLPSLHTCLIMLNNIHNRHVENTFAHCDKACSVCVKVQSSDQHTPVPCQL